MQPAKLVQSIECVGDDYLLQIFSLFFTCTSLISSMMSCLLVQVANWGILGCIRFSSSLDDGSTCFPSSDLSQHVKFGLAWSLCLPSSDLTHVSSLDWCTNGPLPILELGPWALCCVRILPSHIYSIDTNPNFRGSLLKSSISTWTMFD